MSLIGRRFTRDEINAACDGLDALRAQTAELDLQAAEEADELIAAGWPDEEQWRVECVGGRRYAFVRQPATRSHYATIWTPADGRVTYHGPR